MLSTNLLTVCNQRLYMYLLSQRRKQGYQGFSDKCIAVVCDIVVLRKVLYALYG